MRFDTKGMATEEDVNGDRITNVRMYDGNKNRNWKKPHRRHRWRRMGHKGGSGKKSGQDLMTAHERGRQQVHHP